MMWNINDKYQNIFQKPQNIFVMTSGDNQYPVSVCLQYRETLSLEACRYQFPVETCVANPELLGKSNDLSDLLI